MCFMQVRGCGICVLCLYHRTDINSKSNYNVLVGLIDAGRGAARAEDAQGTPTQSHISPSKLVYEDKTHEPHSLRLCCDKEIVMKLNYCIHVYAQVDVNMNLCI